MPVDPPGGWKTPSPYCIRGGWGAAFAGNPVNQLQEGTSCHPAAFPRGLKPISIFAYLLARLKQRPFKTGSFGVGGFPPLPQKGKTQVFRLRCASLRMTARMGHPGFCVWERVGEHG